MRVRCPVTSLHCAVFVLLWLSLFMKYEEDGLLIKSPAETLPQDTQEEQSAAKGEDS